MYEQLKLEKQLCFRLYTASRLITQAYRPYFEPLGITYPQYLVLMVLWEHDKLPVETNTVTPLLQRMERDGLIVRTRGTVDSRQRVVSLTKKGSDMQEQAKEIPSCMSKMWVGNKPTVDDMLAMAKTLDDMIETLKK